MRKTGTATRTHAQTEQKLKKKTENRKTENLRSLTQ